MLELAYQKEYRMFCPNCGKQIKDCDNFCRYCGYDLRDDFATVVPAEGAEKQHEILEEYVLPSDNEEELVLYDVRKHWMAFFWPVIITPVFFVYFWTIFLNTHSLLSWFVVFLLLLPVIYPLLRYSSDKIVITTKYIHIKLGVLNPVEVDIRLNKAADVLEVSQSAMGKLLDYGILSFTHGGNRYDYGYIKSPQNLEYAIDEPARFVGEVLDMDVSESSKL